MTDKGGIGVTVISHDSENRTLVAGFEAPGSYWRDVTYDETSLIQLASLTASSSHSKGVYLCELLATDKYTETEKFHANVSFHHYSPLVRSLHMFGDKHSL